MVLAKRNILLFTSLFVALASSFVYQSSKIVVSDLADEDLRNLYWIQRFQDSHILLDDELTPEISEYTLFGYTFVIDKLAPGYSIIFLLLSWLIPPILLSKLLIFPLTLFSVYFIFQIGRIIRDENLAFSLGVGFLILNFASSSNIATYGGLQRSFTFPLILGFIYYMLVDNYLKASLIIFFCGVLYPPTFLLLSLIYSISMIFKEKINNFKNLAKSPQIIAFLISLILVILILSPALIFKVENPTFNTPEVSNSYNYKTDRLDLNIRYPLFAIFPFVGAGSLFISIIDTLNALVMLIFAVIIVVILRKKTNFLNPIFKYAVTASFVGFLISWLGILITNSMIFHLPSRLTQSIIPIVLLIFIIVNIRETIKSLLLKVTSILHHNVKGITYNNINPPSIFYWSIGLITIFISTIYITNLPDSFYSPPNSQKDLLAFIKTLPKGILIAGHPCSLDNIPLYAQRKILFSCEKPHPDPNVIQDGLFAYYETDTKEVENFCNKYSIDYLVIAKKHFEPEYLIEKKLFYEPYNSMIKSKIENQKSFALTKINTSSILFESEEHLLMPCTASAFIPQN